jgi:GNAT superfamily N-acetyltransferase
MIDIRRALQEDAAGVQELLLQLGYDSCEGDVRSKLAVLSERASDPVLVAVEGVRLLGVLALHWTPMLHLAAPLARITALVVRDEARGTGVGRRLVDAAAILARNAGCTQLELTTSLRRTDAQAFYRAIGFLESSVRLSRTLP